MQQPTDKLKDQFGPDVPMLIGREILAVCPQFDIDAFVRDSLEGYEALELKQRAQQVAQVLALYLPADFEAAVDTLIASLGSPLSNTEGNGMSPFCYWPHGIFVAEHGLDHFEAAMRAQYELTQRFTAEFSIRPFLEKDQERTLARLREWAFDPNPHVRRLVSEGTRPRLPWASRLRDFQRDPEPVLALLELLKDDPSLYVRRSVANNLNDIGKDHPETLIKTAQSWMVGASPERQWIVRHALRSAIKRGEAGALAMLGFGKAAEVTIQAATIQPAQAVIGGAVQISFEITNSGKESQQLLIDFRIHYVKANGKTSPKVFKLKTLTLTPSASAKLQKRISLAEMTTRKHYAGRHEIELLINGSTLPLGVFELRRPTNI